MSDDEEFQYTEERPAYGPEGRWAQLRTQRDSAIADARRLRSALHAVEEKLTNFGLSDEQAVEAALAIVRSTDAKSCRPPDG